MLKIRSIIFLLVVIFFGSVLTGQKKTDGNSDIQTIEKIINSQWTFNYFPSEKAETGYESPRFNDSKWPAVSIPHTWSTYETTGEFNSLSRNRSVSNNPYWRIGWGWYRKHFTISSTYNIQKAFLEFEGVHNLCKVFLNGKYLGDNKGGRGSFIFDISACLKPDEDNVLAVAVNNYQEDKASSTPDINEAINLCGGIYGNVKIILKKKLYFLLKGLSSREGGILITTPSVSEKEAVVRVEAHVKNDNTGKRDCILQTTISDANGKKVQVIKSSATINPGQLYVFDQMSKPVKKPHLWKKTDPYVYKIYSELIEGEETMDSYLNPDGLMFISDKDINVPETIPQNPYGIEEIFVNNMNETTVSSTNSNISGEAARIILTSLGNTLKADRGSVSILTADIVDSEGHHVTDPDKTIKWIVAGPAILVGPSVYSTRRLDKGQLNENWFGSMPVSNAVRSTGIPGKITVTVFATGLSSGSCDIQAEEALTDNSVIIEPALDDAGRRQVDRPVLIVDRLNDIPSEIKMTDEDINFGKADRNAFKVLIRDYMLKKNPAIDSTFIEFRVLIDLFAAQLFNNNGHISSIDYNFTVDHYNNSRLISGYIVATRLPTLFKDGLRKYYADLVIKNGSERNAGEEMNWLNWIPSGGTVVISTTGNGASYPKGTKITASTRLPDLIELVYPVYKTFSNEAKERALIFISKMNPYVRVVPLSDQIEKDNKQKEGESSYRADKDHPILIPDLKFISE